MDLGFIVDEASLGKTSPSMRSQQSQAIPNYYTPLV